MAHKAGSGAQIEQTGLRPPEALELALHPQAGVWIVRGMLRFTKSQTNFINVLQQAFHTNEKAKMLFENYTYVSMIELVDELEVNERAVRKVLSRIRQAINLEYVSRYGSQAPHSILIEYSPTKNGYRLNPKTRFVAHAQIATEPLSQQKSQPR